jgi:hypothetical protein
LFHVADDIIDFDNENVLSVRSKIRRRLKESMNIIVYEETRRRRVVIINFDFSIVIIGPRDIDVIMR